MAGETLPGAEEVSPGLQAYNEAVAAGLAALQQPSAVIADVLVAIQAQQEAGVELLEDSTLDLREFVVGMRAAYLAANRLPIQLSPYDSGFITTAVRNYGKMAKRAADFPLSSPSTIEKTDESASEITDAEAIEIPLGRTSPAVEALESVESAAGSIAAAAETSSTDDEGSPAKSQGVVESAESEESPAAAAPSPRTDLTRQDTSRPKP